MRARRFWSEAVVLVGALALAGCGARTTAPIPEPPPEPPVKPPGAALKNDGPSVPVTPADKVRIEGAEKKGAAIYEVQNGGFELRIEANTDPEPILALLKETKCIVGLSIEGDKLTDVVFRYVSGFEYLEQLALHRCPNLTGAGFDALAKWTRLKSLTVSECPITDAACAHIGAIKSLEEVRFIRTKVTDTGLRELAALPALEALGLEGSPVSGSAFAAPGWPRLRDIDAPTTLLDDTGMQGVAGLPELRSLRVDSRKITDAGLVQLKRATKLAELSMSGTKITDTGLLALKELGGLRELDVSNTMIQGSGFGSFPARPGLRKLNVSGTSFDDAGTAHLAKFPGLVNLALADCRVSDAGLAVLKGMKKLAKCDVSGTAAGDDTAKIVGALPDLDDANFARTKLTDAGVNALVAGTKIRQIDARETKVTKEGAERAKMGRVRLEIRVE